MSVKCPNCGHIRTPEDDAVVPDWKCPACDIVYSKFVVRSGSVNHNNTSDSTEREPTSDAKPKKTESDPSHKTKYLIAGVAVTAFTLGYFAGREHIKYEMRQAMTAAANQFKQSVTEIFAPPKEESKAPSESKPSNQKTLGVSLIRKGYRDFDMDIGNKAVTFALSFTNTLGKSIRAFDGLLVFSDLLDNPIKKLNLSYTKPINSNEAVTWEGEMDYNQFIDSDRALRSKDVSDLKVKLILRKVLYADGTTEEF